MSALIYFINTETGSSKTSIEQAWGQPSGSWKDQYKKPLKISDVYKKPKQYDKSEILKPFDVKLTDLFGINCTIQDIEEVKDMNKDLLKLKADLKLKNAEMAKKKEEEEILVTAMNLVFFQMKMLNLILI